MKATTCVLLLLLCFSCTEKQQASGRNAEIYYADLYVAIHTGNSKEARRAASGLEEAIAKVRRTWIRPSVEDEIDDVYFRIDRAQGAFESTLTALEAEELSLAAIQLDRATYELKAADLESFRVLYLGAIYPLLSTWYGFNEVIKSVDFCHYESSELQRYAVFVLQEWEKHKATEPSLLIYTHDDAMTKKMDDIKEEIGLELDLLLDTLVDCEDIVTRQRARQTNELILELVQCFGTNQAITLR
jgi:hypothetical protein